MLLGSFALLIGISGAAGARQPASGIARIMGKPAYRLSRWGLLEVDPRSGARIQALNPTELFIPGSTTKLFSISAAWNTLGGEDRFTTPVYALGSRQGTALNGNLVLVAAGDLTMGGRTTKRGAVAFTSIDHIDANSIPGATLTPENPLAGLNQIARQVRRAGITHVNGNVVVHDRAVCARPRAHQRGSRARSDHDQRQPDRRAGHPEPFRPAGEGVLAPADREQHADQRGPHNSTESGERRFPLAGGSASRARDAWW